MDGLYPSRGPSRHAQADSDSDTAMPPGLRTLGIPEGLPEPLTLRVHACVLAAQAALEQDASMAAVAVLFGQDYHGTPVLAVGLSGEDSERNAEVERLRDLCRKGEARAVMVISEAWAVMRTSLENVYKTSPRHCPDRYEVASFYLEHDPGPGQGPPQAWAALAEISRPKGPGTPATFDPAAVEWAQLEHRHPGERVRDLLPCWAKTPAPEPTPAPQPSPEPEP